MTKRHGLIAIVTAGLLAATTVPAFGSDDRQVKVLSRPGQVTTEPGYAGQEITLPNGQKVVLPKDFDQMTSAELAAVGIVPGMGSGVAAAGTLSRPGLQPLNATSCGFFVCTEVTGQSTLVYSWLTQLTTSRRVCSYASFWQGSRIVATSRQVCGTKLTAYITNMPRRFADGTKLCNSWINYSEKRCITIEE